MTVVSVAPTNKEKTLHSSGTAGATITRHPNAQTGKSRSSKASDTGHLAVCLAWQRVASSWVGALGSPSVALPPFLPSPLLLAGLAAVHLVNRRHRGTRTRHLPRVRASHAHSQELALCTPPQVRAPHTRLRERARPVVYGEFLFHVQQK